MSRWGELIPHSEDDPGCLCGCLDESADETDGAGLMCNGGPCKLVDTPWEYVAPSSTEALQRFEQLEAEGIIPSKFEADVCDVYEQARRVLLKKHQDYGPKNISLSPGGPLNGLRVRMHDKLARINNLLDSGATPENESLRDSFLDLMNYSAIAQLVLDGNWPDE